MMFMLMNEVGCKMMCILGDVFVGDTYVSACMDIKLVLKVGWFDL